MTRTPGRKRTAFLAAALLALSGCGTPAPGPSSPPPVSVPSIPAPLDGAGFLADPCTAITVEQVESMGFTDGRRGNGRAGECLLGFGPTVEVTVSWLTPLRESIGSLYRDHATGRDIGNRWEELAIQGYPAVVVRAEENIARRQHEGPLACKLALGVDDDTLVYVGANTRGRAEAGPWQYDSCGAAEKIAGFVIENLRS
ncbi:DUF3558 domain-containing protein [Amycolatopsis sp. lyj-112]|uniref:DUF3558 domain-containing protein n=1 Tax=Amycolatopsis sp. lyj-112 TaxID=2789288 RepID=UPI00397C1150